MSEPEAKRSAAGLKPYALIVLALSLLALALGFVGVPIPLIPTFSVIVTAVFVIAPFLALYVGASAADASVRLVRLKVPVASVLLVVGVLLHAGSIALLQLQLVSGLAAAVVSVFGQAGLVTWCLGLGGLLGMLVKDKNMLVPISVFLALFDVFLVLTPVGLTQQVMQKAPKLQTSVSLVIPRVVETPTAGPVMPLAYIGPADLLFAAMFFTVLFRQRMRTRETFLWLGPVLVLYLVAALLFGSLPALVPIGLCVLLVNFREFKLNKEEWASTGLVAALGLGLIIWGFSMPKSRAAPLPPAAAPGAPVQGGSPRPEQPNPRP